MTEDDLAKMTYSQKEKRLDEILGRLDRSETPMDELAAEATEAAMLIKSMEATLTSTKAQLANVFQGLERPTETS